MNIAGPTQVNPGAPIWRLAFRAGFLCAAIFAVLAMTRWLLWMFDPSAWDASISPHWWHAHEMIFGFAMPVVAGFLLSAVATWTGLPGTTGNRLKVLFGLWFTARIALWLFPGALLIAWGAEMLFLLLLMTELGTRVWAKKQWRNILFLPVLLALAALSSGSYLYSDNTVISTRVHYGALWMISVLVVIVGGRVIPLFTGNKLGIKITPLPAWLDYTAIGSTALIGLLMVAPDTQQFKTTLQVLCCISLAVHGYRLAHWQGWKTLQVPLLWSMHLSYLCIPLALLGLLLAGENPVVTKNIMHWLGVGTVGGMTLTMMSRVSLGHTGRPMNTPSGMALAFALVLLAAAIRSLTPLFAPELTLWAWRVSAAAWIIAFAIFSYRYFPILSAPRVDGKPG